jgi:hypothetical protein
MSRAPTVRELARKLLKASVNQTARCDASIELPAVCLAADIEAGSPDDEMDLENDEDDESIDVA